MPLKIIFLSLFFLLLFSCSNTTASSEEEGDNLLSTSTPLGELMDTLAPFELKNKEVKFYKDIPYGTDSRHRFDIFLPSSQTPSSLVLFLHGGAFILGSKEQAYSSTKYTSLIDSLLENNIAFATANYRLIKLLGEDIGILKPIRDSKRVLQFIRYYAAEFNIDKENVIIIGESAGAGTALWIGLSDDMADPSSNDPVFHESTRLSGMVCIETQSNYNVLNWHNTVFKEYTQNTNPVDSQWIIDIIGQGILNSYAGVSNSSDFGSKVKSTYSDSLDMLKMMSSDDPDIYVSNTSIKNQKPTNLNELYHHPLHAKILMDKAKEVGMKGVFNYTGIKEAPGKTIFEFIQEKFNP
jgi:hypothetical protein